VFDAIRELMQPAVPVKKGQIGFQSPKSDSTSKDHDTG
jgi:hypothetical protein